MEKWLNLATLHTTGVYAVIFKHDNEVIKYIISDMKYIDAHIVRLANQNELLWLSYAI